MITRIVKMQILESKIDNYQEIVKPYVANIISFPGCKGVRVLKDKNSKTIIFTYSLWESEQDLEKYRKSEMFREIWYKVKQLFSVPAEAWTVVDAF